jgi:hypothetical protein
MWPFPSLRKKFAVKFEGKFYIKVGRFNRREQVNFTLVDNQNGFLVAQAVDATGAPATMPSDVVATSSDSTIATVSVPAGNILGTFKVTAVKAGNVNIIVTGSAGLSAPISTSFAFVITGGPAVGFTATLTNVGNN